MSYLFVYMLVYAFLCVYVCVHARTCVCMRACVCSVVCGGGMVGACVCARMYMNLFVSLFLHGGAQLHVLGILVDAADSWLCRSRNRQMDSLVKCRLDLDRL